MNRATLVAVHIGSTGFLDDLHGGQLSWFLVVLDVVADLQIQLSAQGSGKMGEELRLENTVHERIGLLCANDKGEPVVFQVRCADGFDSSNRYRSLGRDSQLIVDDSLRYNIYMSARL